MLTERTGFLGSLFKKGLARTLVGYFDRDLADYAQYEDLIRHLRSSEHSIVLLSGDVHFGRVSHGELKVDSPVKLVEVISSPMQAVLGNEGKPLFGDYRDSPTLHFPGLESMEVAHASNHFTTIEFSAGEGRRTDMRVWVWPTLSSEGEAPLGDYQPVFETVLD